jgi:hypothetical protein
MIETLGIIAAISLVIWAIVRFFNWIGKGVSNSVHTNSSQTTRIEVSFPDPEKANDFKFYKYIKWEPVYKLEPTYNEMKKRGMKIKPEFEKAIQTKIKSGEFKNPLDFKDYFGTSFDLIGVQFLKGTDNLLSAFQIGVCFIQKGKVADTDTYDFRPPERIMETKRFQKTLELFDYEQEWIESNSFKDIWEIFELRDFLNTNLIVVWDEEAEILEKVLKNNRIKDYNISILKIREVAQANNLPDLIDSLLEYFNSDLSLKDDMSLIVSDLAVELKDSGIDINNYVKTISSKTKQTKPTKKPKAKNMVSIRSVAYCPLAAEHISCGEKHGREKVY